MSELTLKVIRKNYTHANKTLWHTLVEESSDSVLLAIVNRCWKSELEFIAYYAIVENRHRFLQSWWSSPQYPQITSESDITNVILALHTLRKLTNPVPILLTVIKWRALRALYTSHLSRNSNLIRLLVYLCSHLSNGASLLFQEWKRYEYDIPTVWNGQLFIKLSVQPEDKTVYINNSTHVYASHAIDHICQYGSPKDLKLMFRYPDWWVPHHLVDISSNYNDSTFKYLIEYLWCVKKVCEHFQPINVDQSIWRAVWIVQLFDEMLMSEMLDALREHRSWRRRVRQLNWALPELCTARQVTHVFGLDHVFTRFDRRFMYTRYLYFNAQSPKHYTVEDLLSIEKHTPILVPDIVGRTWNNSLPDNVFPQLYIFPRMISKIVKIKNKIIYVVMDVDFQGNWYERLTHLRKLHRYSDSTFEQFIESTSERRLWWVVQPITGLCASDFFAQLERLPAFSKGWLVAAKNGLYLKVQHESFLYAQQYQNGEWSFPEISPNQVPAIELTPTHIENVISDLTEGIEPTKEELHDKSLKLTAVFNLAAAYYDNLSLSIKDRLKLFLLNGKCGCIQYLKNNYYWMVTGVKPAYFRAAQLVWRCVWNREENKWRPLEYAFHKSKPSELATFDLLTKRNKYPVRFTELVKHVAEPPVKERLTVADRERRTLEDALITALQKNIPATISFGGCQPRCNSVFTVITDNPYNTTSALDSISYIWTDLKQMSNPATGEPVSFKSSTTIFEVIRWMHVIVLNNAVKEFMNAIKSFKFGILAFDDADLGAMSPVSFHAIHDEFTLIGWKFVRSDELGQFRVCLFSNT